MKTKEKVVQEQDKGEVIKLSQKEITDLEKKIERELATNNWKHYAMNDIINCKNDVNKLLNKPEIEKFVIYHSDISSYPNHIVAGKTWNLLMHGFLQKHPVIKEQLLKFFEEDHETYLAKIKWLSKKPIIMIGDYNKKLAGKILPIKVKYKGKNVLVLYINQITESKAA